MLKIHQVFILKFILLLAGTLLVSLLISYVTLKTIIVEHNQKHLQDTIMMLELDIENLDDLDLHAKKIAKATGL
ncbi:MAG: sensor histidine kinase, partial [Sulfurimonadaceae bacterium]